MRDFRDVTAVVTGAGSGIGRGLCCVLAEEGARIVAADVESSALDGTVALLRERGATAIGQPTDVSDGRAVEALAARAEAELGAVQVLCNNAGVFVGGWLWEATDADWEWALGVNLRGVVHGIRAFVPRMLAQAGEGHVLNTASISGIVTAPLSGVYSATKFAVVGLSECLWHDLAMQSGGRIAVSVAVPGAVDTAIARSDRNRPAHLRAAGETEAVSAVTGALAQTTAAGASPLDAARRLVAGMKAGEFYIPTSDSYERQVAAANATRLARRAPVFQVLD